MYEGGLRRSSYTFTESMSRRDNWLTTHVAVNTYSIQIIITASICDGHKAHRRRDEMLDKKQVVGWLPTKVSSSLKWNLPCL